MTRAHLLLLLLLLTACDSTGPAPYEEFIVEMSSNSATNAGATAEIDATVRVTELLDPATRVNGAIVRFQVTRGSVSPPEDVSAGLGRASTHWSLVLPITQMEHLSACASNSQTRCDTYWDVLTVSSAP